jgi:hypothetical protein
MRQVMTYMKFINSSTDLQHKVESFYMYRFANKTMFDDHLIANELPVKLRTEIVLHRFEDIIQRVPFFKGLKEDVIVDVCMQLQEFAVMPSDPIVMRGDPYRELVIMIKGMSRSVPYMEEESNTPSPRKALHGIIAGTSPRTAGNHSPGGASAPLGAGLHVVVEFQRGTFFGELEFLGLSSERSTTIEV